MNKLLQLKETEIIEYDRFDAFFDLCFEVSDYFSFTTRNFHNQDEEDYKNFLQELQPFFVKKFETLHWFCYYIQKNQSLEVNVFRSDNQAKSIIRKYFDNIFLHHCSQNVSFDGAVKKAMPEDLCFYIKNMLFIGTVSHACICYMFPPNDEVKNRFERICKWEILDYEKEKDEQCCIDGNEYLRMDALYFLLQLLRKAPKHYLAEKSLLCLYSFIRGYSFGASGENENYIDFSSQWDNFVFSRYDKYDKKPIKIENWQSAISQHSNSQEEAFDKFYELLDEFLKTKENKAGGD